MKKTSKRNPTDAVEIIHRRYYEGRPQRMAELAEAEANDTVAREILRTPQACGPHSTATRQAGRHNYFGDLQA